MSSIPSPWSGAISATSAHFRVARRDPMQRKVLLGGADVGTSRDFCGLTVIHCCRTATLYGSHTRTTPATFPSTRASSTSRTTPSTWSTSSATWARNQRRHRDLPARRPWPWPRPPCWPKRTPAPSLVRDPDRTRSTPTPRRPRRPISVIPHDHGRTRLPDDPAGRLQVSRRGRMVYPGSRSSARSSP